MKIKKMNYVTSCKRTKDYQSVSVSEGFECDLTGLKGEFDEYATLKVKVDKRVRDRADRLLVELTAPKNLLG